VYAPKKKGFVRCFRWASRVHAVAVQYTVQRAVRGQGWSAPALPVTDGSVPSTALVVARHQCTGRWAGKGRGVALRLAPSHARVSFHSDERVATGVPVAVVMDTALLSEFWKRGAAGTTVHSLTS
jgi:hypothetical protein